jgi:hypothetical protein
MVEGLLLQGVRQWCSSGPPGVTKKGPEAQMATRSQHEYQFTSKKSEVSDGLHQHQKSSLEVQGCPMGLSRNLDELNETACCKVFDC